MVAGMTTRKRGLLVGIAVVGVMLVALLVVWIGWLL